MTITTRRRVEVMLMVALMMLAGATTTLLFLLFLTSGHGTERALKDSKAEIVENVESNPEGILI